MIELNLLPKELRRKKESQIHMPAIPVIPVAAGVIGVLIILHITLVVFTINSKHLLKVLEDRWDGMQQQTMS